MYKEFYFNYKESAVNFQMGLFKYFLEVNHIYFKGYIKRAIFFFFLNNRILTSQICFRESQHYLSTLDKMIPAEAAATCNPKYYIYYH